MATKIQAEGDTIKLSKTFTGKDKIEINGEQVFEGKLVQGKPKTVHIGDRSYTVESQSSGKVVPIITYQLQIVEDEELIHREIYDIAGKRIKSEGALKTSGAIKACGFVGMIVGLTTMMTLNRTTGVVPGGAIGGAIGGGLGALLGQGFGLLIFGKPEE